MKSEEARKSVRKKIDKKNIDCSVCNSEKFKIEVWDVGSREPRCAIICTECNSRMQICHFEDNFNESHL